MNGASVPGIQRGCGYRKRGAVYLECNGSPYSTKPLTDFLLDPPMLMDVDCKRGVQLQERRGTTMVTDFVGASNYPFASDFIVEGMKYGFSRLVSANLDFSRIQPGSRLLLVHEKGLVINPEALRPYLTHQTLTRGQPYTVAEVNTPGPTLGVSSKTLTLVADLACPHCADFDRVKGQHLEQQAQAGKLQFAYLLVARREGGDLAGNAALCVFEQNPQAFWAYKSTLYNLDTLREETLIQAAAPLNLNQATFKMCVKNQTHAKTLEHNERMVKELGVQGTPTLIAGTTAYPNPSTAVVTEVAGE